MSSKLKKIIISALAAVLIIGGVSLGVMYYLGDRLIEEAIKEDIHSADETGNDATTPTSSMEESGQAQQEDKSSMAAEQPAPVETAASTTDKITSQTHAKAENLPANKGTVIENEKISEIKKEVSAQDKITAAALILKRLSASDVNELKNMLPGGLNAEEKEKAKQIAYSRFTEAEIAEIKDMYIRYMN